MPGIFFRNSIVPRPGKVFLILDESQIEPRVLRWLAHDEAFLDQSARATACTERLRVHIWVGPAAHSKGNPELYRWQKPKCSPGVRLWRFEVPRSGAETGRAEDQRRALKEIVYGFPQHNGLVKNFWDDMQRAVEKAAAAGEPLQIVMPNGETMWRGSGYGAETSLTAPK